MPAWPASLPQDWLIDGYSEQLRDGVIRSEMATGPEHTRRRTSAVPTDVRASLHLDQAQRNTFEAFVNDELAGGALPFTHYRMGRPEGDSVEYRFSGPPQFEVATLKVVDGGISIVWKAAMELVILP